jgi:uncharacterized protein YndB with AHSA1/START domain
MTETNLADQVVFAENAYPAPIEKVWRAWTDPDRLKQWFGPKPGSLHSTEVDLREGGIWRFIFSGPGQPYAALEGAYVEIEAPSRLVFSWRHVSEDADGQRTATPDSTVAATKQPTEGGTLVQVRHSNPKTTEGVTAGWKACLGNLVSLLEAEALAPG